MSNQLLSTDGRYYDNWRSYEDLPTNYKQLPADEKIIYAGYTYEDYSGSAIIVFIGEDGQAYENHDGHCSCYGLEDWNPEKADLKAIKGYRFWPGLQEAIHAWEIKVLRHTMTESDEMRPDVPTEADILRS